MCSTREQHRLDMCFVSAESEWQRVWEAQHRNMYVYVWKWKNIVLILRKNILPSEPGWKIFFAKCKYLVKGEKSPIYSALFLISYIYLNGCWCSECRTLWEKSVKGMKNNPRNNIGDILNSYHHQHINIQQPLDNSTFLHSFHFNLILSIELWWFPLSFLEYDGTKVYVEIFIIADTWFCLLQIEFHAEL